MYEFNEMPKEGSGIFACAYCDRPFERKRAWQKFCSAECRVTHNTKEKKMALEEYRQMKKSRGITQ